MISNHLYFNFSLFLLFPKMLNFYHLKIKQNKTSLDSASSSIFVPPQINFLKEQSTFTLLHLFPLTPVWLPPSVLWNPLQRSSIISSWLNPMNSSLSCLTSFQRLKVLPSSWNSPPLNSLFPRLLKNIFPSWSILLLFLWPLLLGREVYFSLFAHSCEC